MPSQVTSLSNSAQILHISLFFDTDHRNIRVKVVASLIRKMTSFCDFYAYF